MTLFQYCTVQYDPHTIRGLVPPAEARLRFASLVTINALDYKFKLTAAFQKALDDQEAVVTLLKLSGETLGDSSNHLSHPIIQRLAHQIKGILSPSLQLGIVIGGGNIWRGAPAADEGQMDRNTADYMGMLATVINSLALQDALEHAGVETRVLTAIEMKNVAEPFIRRRALRHLEKGRVVIFSAGTGHPFFSTDTTAALRASEIGADALLKATKVDGIYDSDPRINPRAQRFQTITYGDALRRRLQVMDSTAFSLCMDNKIPIVVFDVFREGNLRAAAEGRPVGTRVIAGE